MAIPTNPDLIQSIFASGGNRTQPPQTDPSGFVNFEDGYTPDYEIDLNSGDSAAKAVERPVQNYLFGLMTEIGQFWQQMGAPPWYSTMPGGYNQGSIVGRVSTGGQWRVYRSLVNANVVDPNLNGQTNWEYVPLNTELLSQVPMPAGGVAEIAPGGQVTELIQAATDFNTLTTGTWEYGSDIIANGSAHAPVQLGLSGSFAGLLQAKQWTLSGTAFNAQIYCDRTGNLFVRGAQGGVWTAWNSITPVNTFSVDTGVANAVQGNAPLASATIANGAAFLVQIAAANTGATTYSPNTSVTAHAVVGMDGNPLQGGELAAGGKAQFEYNATGTMWTLVYCSGGSQTGVKAVHANQFPLLTQIPSPEQGLLTVSTDFNTLTMNGTWEFATDALVSGSANHPSVTGGTTALAGELRVHAWVGSGNTIINQEFQDRNGEIWTRSNFNTVWTAWSQKITFSESTGRLLRISVYTIISGVQNVSVNGGAFTSTGASTFNSLPQTNSILFEGVGGGGSGGGSPACSATQATGAGGGGGGAYFKGFLTSGFSGGIPITIGAAGVAASGTIGTNGGTTSFGAIASAPGGGFGTAGSASSVFPQVNGYGAAALQATGGNLVNACGGFGSTAFAFTATSAISGSGGASVWSGTTNAKINVSSAGINATAPGGGGSGALTIANGAASAGGNGAPGQIIVYEFS